MGLHSILINEFGRLRSGWRLVLYVLAFIAASFLVATIAGAGYLAARAIYPSFPHPHYFADLIFRFSTLCAALIAGYLCVRLFEGLPWRSLGLTRHKGWMRDLIIGTAIGIVALAFAVGIATAGGGLRFSFIGNGLLLSAGKSLVASTVLFLAAALAEEAAFRGYPLQTLTRAHLIVFGVLLTSLPFGFVHLNNPNVVPGVTFANTALAGVWLAAAYLKTRSLWFPWGVHFGWNWALDWFFGLPVSGARISSQSLLLSTDIGPAWLTGGRYGIEGGIACTIALIACTLFIWRTGLVSATPELKKLTSDENPATPQPVVSVLPSNNRA